MRNAWIFVLPLFLAAAAGCEDRTGYLDAGHAHYVPDTLSVKAVLEPEKDADDARRAEFRIPWQSPVIQGVEGTNPRAYRVFRVEDGEGERVDDVAAAQFRMGVNGIIELPWNHTVPPGRYRIGLEISNMDGKNKAFFPALFTFIVAGE